MSRLDQHVSTVQNKLALGKFVNALVWTIATFALIVFLAILVDRLFWLRPPHWPIWFWSGVGAAAVAALSYAIWRRPDSYEAAVKIDDVLNTKDKFATALHVRTVNDPFAHAAVLDAERTADGVSLHKKFPLTTPRKLYVPIGMVVIALIATRMQPMDLFGREAKKTKQIEAQAKVEQANKTLQNALAVVAAVPPALKDNEQIKLAKEGLLQQLNQPIKDPARADRTAAKALQDVNEAIKEQIKQNQKYAEAQNEAKMLRNLQVPTEEKGPVADAQRELAKGNFSEAVSELNKVAENFDKMSKKDQEKAADQMQNMANQLKQMANNPQHQQQMQQQMQQAGMNQKQAEEAVKQMQQAANGDKQAQQQLQQMAQQAMKQMNNGQGPNQQQQQAIQQAIQQAQAQANAQQNAQNMQQAAQQMAKAMQQMAQQQQQQAGQNQQQAKGQNQRQQNQQQQQQAGGQQAQQQMAQGLQGMQQQMQQMQAAAQDAQQIAGAQQAAQNAAQQAMDAMNAKPGGNGQQQGQGNWQGQGQNKGGGDPNQPWGGQPNDGLAQNNGGQGAGDRSGKQQAPYQVKPEMSPSIDDEKGKILASTLVKGAALKGESKEQLKEVIESAIKNQADEIDQDRVSRQAQRVVRDYFSSIQNDTAAPTTAPSK